MATTQLPPTREPPTRSRAGERGVPLPVKLTIAALPVTVVGGLLALVLVAGSLSGGGSSTDPATSCTLTAPEAASGATVPSGLDAAQLRNAATIVAVGRRLGVPDRGLVIALATALQESTLRNLDYGDRDSLGLFQQRAGWGIAAQRTDSASATQLFFSGGVGGQPGLLDVAGWQSMPLTEAAQAVQRSAFPDAYAAWQPVAEQLLAAPVLAGAACLAPADGTLGAAVVAAAMRWAGTPYSWGGGDLQGPSVGFGAGAGVVGFDCSSLVRYAWYAATGGALTLPRVTSDQAKAGARLPAGVTLAPGDLMFFHDPSDPPEIYHHVGIYAGRGSMVHAPHTGAVVELVPNVLDDPYYRAQFAVAIRPVAAKPAASSVAVSSGASSSGAASSP